MAGVEDLIAYLALGDKQKAAIASEDPYSGFGSIGGQIGKIAATSGPDYSLRDKAIYAALGGLTSGIFGSLSSGYQNRATDEYQQAVLGSLKGEPLSGPSVLSDSLFKQANQEGSIFKLKQQIQEAEAQKALSAEINKTVIGEIAKNPDKAAEITAALKGVIDPKLVTIAAPLGESEQVDFNKHKALLKKYGGDETMVTAELKRDLEAPDRMEALRKDTYSKINLLPSVAQFQKMNTTIPTLEQYSGLDTKSSDFPFIYAFVQGLDGGVVKEGEVSAISGNNPLIEKYKNLFQSNLNGGSALGTDLKQQMVAELKAARNATYESAKSQTQPVIASATLAGLDLKNQYAAMPYNPDMTFGGAPTTPTAPVEAGRAALIAEARRRGLM